MCVCVCVSIVHSLDSFPANSSFFSSVLHKFFVPPRSTIFPRETFERKRYVCVEVFLSHNNIWCVVETLILHGGRYRYVNYITRSERVVTGLATIRGVTPFNTRLLDNSVSGVDNLPIRISGLL